MSKNFDSNVKKGASSLTRIFYKAATRLNLCA